LDSSHAFFTKNLRNSSGTFGISRYSRLGLKIVPVKILKQGLDSNFVVEKIRTKSGVQYLQFPYSLLIHTQRVLEIKTFDSNCKWRPHDTDRHLGFLKEEAKHLSRQIKLQFFFSPAFRYAPGRVIIFFTIRSQKFLFIRSPDFCAYYAMEFRILIQTLSWTRAFPFYFSGGLGPNCTHSIILSTSKCPPSLETQPEPVPKNLEV